ncbi:protein CBFA2T2-like [Montipora capricornis]|uniref:protein CBFA2T2-like n=1 Tax=Montipora capricornis TaxID=246305 RepID=UPI0035F1D2A5
MSVKNLPGRVKELRELMESCQERMTNLLQDYQLNVLQTAAVIAAAKISEEKAEIEKKRQCLREQIEKEKQRGRETVSRVYKSAGETIENLINDHEKEIQKAMERQYRVSISHGFRPFTEARIVKAKIAKMYQTWLYYVQISLNPANVRNKTEDKRNQHLAGVKRKRCAFEESEVFDNKKEPSKCALNEKEESLQCTHCGKVSQSMFICTQCHTAMYCDEQCQEKDWERHQQHCTEACSENSLGSHHD